MHIQDYSSVFWYVVVHQEESFSDLHLLPILYSLDLI